MRSIVQLSLSSRSPPRTFRTHGRTPPPSSIDGGPTPRWWNMLKMVSIIPHYLTSKIYILRDIKLKITLLIFICIFHYYIGIFITNFHFYFYYFATLQSNQVPPPGGVAGRARPAAVPSAPTGAFFVACSRRTLVW